MTNKTFLYLGLAVLTISLLTFIGFLAYIFAPVFSQGNAGIGAVGGSLFSIIFFFLPIIGIISGLILTMIGFVKSINNKDLR